MNRVVVHVLLGLGLAAAAAAAYRQWRALRALRRSLANERAGRTKAERALRERLQEQQSSEGHVLRPIGYVDSCFPARCGTPRQGVLAPHARGRIVLSKHIPPAALEGLGDYSHLWVIFVFGDNTNACSGKGSGAGARTFPAKVAPPQLLGKKTGLFSTRTPHRPCPLGLSVARIDAVDAGARVVSVSGIDLVHGTPVLDIKPYIPAYDSLPSAACARWVTDGGAPVLAVDYAPEALAQARAAGLPPSSLYYPSLDDLLAALTEVLSLDIRSTHQGRGGGGGGGGGSSATPYTMHFDCLRVRFRTQPHGRIVVTELDLCDCKSRRRIGEQRKGEGEGEEGEEEGEGEGEEGEEEA